MNLTQRPLGASLLVTALSLVMASQASAGAKVEKDDTRYINVGAGLRTSLTSQGDAAPSGTDRSKEFELGSIRLYLNGKVHEKIGFTFNTERDSDGDLTVIDGIAQFELGDSVNLWMGRMLPPSDRSNFSGPYFLTTWDFPLVHKYPAIVAGRDDGLAVWGQPGDGRLKYQFGVFQGRDGGSNQEDNPRFTGRLTYNFWDVEKGYYNASTYYGAMDVMTLGLVVQTQADGAGNAANPSDFTGYNLDFLLEKQLGEGAAYTVEAAYYDYDIDNNSFETSLAQGDGYFLLLGYLTPKSDGMGQYQPHVRFQSFDEEGVGDTERLDVGVNYIIDGHNARLSLVYADEDAPGTANDYDKIVFGAQLQF